jgi:hypothetical protein
MEMHVCWQTKTIPIHRIIHADQKGMHPFTDANDVGGHGGLIDVFLSYGAQPMAPIKQRLKLLSLIRLRFFILTALIH